MTLDLTSLSETRPIVIAGKAANLAAIDPIRPSLTTLCVDLRSSSD